MGVCTQREIDSVVTRIKKAVEKYGGRSDELIELRKSYAIMERCKEHGALVMVEAELERLGF